jgi:hypothetical protein
VNNHIRHSVCIWQCRTRTSSNHRVIHCFTNGVRFHTHGLNLFLTKCLFSVCLLASLLLLSCLFCCRQKRYSHNKFFFMFIYNDATLLYYRDLYYTFYSLSLSLSPSRSPSLPLALSLPNNVCGMTTLRAQQDKKKAHFPV